jgi:glycosyltransferase involved in cell wall biosynthesis
LKRICIVTSTYKNITSGVGTYANILVDCLIESGHEVFVISPDCDERPPNFIKINLPKLSVTPNRWFELSIRYSKALNELKFDIVHFLDAREALFFRKKQNTFLIGTVHDTYSWDLQSKNILKRNFLDWKKRLVYYYILHKLESISYRKFDLLLSNTNYVKERLFNFYDISKDKIKTVYLPAPIEKVENSKKEVKDKYIISFVGGNFQRKGLLQLIRAVNELRRLGYDIKIVVAGKDKNQKIIENWIKEQGYESIVDFKGHQKREEVKKIIMHSDVFVMPSITEAYGLVYLEAMALGVPVIGTKEGGTKEVITDGVNGFLCNPDDIKEIADKIKLALDRTVRKKLIENGYETLKKFSKKSFIDEMLRVYESVL